MSVRKANALIDWEQSLSSTLKSAWRSQKNDRTSAIFEDFEGRTVKLRQVARCSFWSFSDAYKLLATSRLRCIMLVRSVFAFFLWMFIEKNEQSKTWESYTCFYSAKANVFPADSRKYVCVCKDYRVTSSEYHEAVLRHQNTTSSGARNILPYRIELFCSGLFHVIFSL